MADDSSLVTTNLGDAEIDEQKGIEMNKTATENVLAEGSSVGTSNISDADLDEGKEVEMNGIATVNFGATQEKPNELSTKCQQNDDKEVIILDDDDDNANIDGKAMKNELSGIPNINGANEKMPLVGMVFTSCEELTSYFKQYALHVGFGVAVKKSSYTKKGVCRRLILVCSKGGRGRTDAMYQARRTAKTNCDVMISAKLWGDGLLHIVEAKLVHNHPVNPSTARFMRCYKRMTNSEQPSGHNNSHSSSSSSNNNMQLLGKECGDAIEIGRLKLAEGDSESIYQFFASMQNKNPNFFYLVDVDEQGRLSNLFWADARSRALFKYFGDVVTFDTTYLTDKFDLPLVSFVGMNHHGQLVLLGCGLISDETVETYTWLFNAWLTSMLGCLPNSIITDQCKAIQDAVMKVFPGVRHRLCLYQILKKVPDKMRGFAEFKAIRKALKKVAYDSLRVEDFEENWKKLIEEYALDANEWLKKLYEDRHSWAPVFLKDDTTMWAGMSVSQRGESVSTFFDGCVYPRTSVKQFFSKFEASLQSKFKKEVHADSESFQKTPLIISKFYMEEQLSKVYTLNMFKKFQDELKATMYCHVNEIKADGSLFTFEIRECSYIEDGKKTESKDHMVWYNADETLVQCICGFYSFHGILCRHALSVFKLQQVFEIPPHYIHNRWKKDFKQLHAFDRYSSETIPSNLNRYDYLSMRFLQLAETGFISEDRYQLSLKLIRNLEKSLLDDTSDCIDRQSKFLCFENHSNQNVQNLLVSQLGFSEGNINPNPMPVKRRGRPPKKSRESNVEPLVQINKEQDFLRSSLIVNEDNVLQAASTVSHLDAHLGHGGIDLMEDLNPNDLSFGTDFGLHINQQHHLSNQTRLQPNSLLQGQYEQQTIGNQTGMQWMIYQQMLQDEQIPKVPSVRRTG